MDRKLYSKLLDLVERLNVLARAYAALSWFSECSAEVPADRASHLMRPIDDHMAALLADFWSLVESMRETS